MTSKATVSTTEQVVTGAPFTARGEETHAESEMTKKGNEEEALKRKREELIRAQEALKAEEDRQGNGVKKYGWDS